MKFLALALILLAQPASAHRLVIYAFAETGEIVIESKFSTGRVPQAGSVSVTDPDGAVLAEFPLDGDGETRAPIPEGSARGVQVNVTTSEGHDDYWILTPADLGREDGN